MLKRNTHVHILLTLCLIGVLVISGCSGSEKDSSSGLYDGTSGDASSSSPSATPSYSENGIFVDLFATYQLDDKDGLVDKATKFLEDKCMAEKGYPQKNEGDESVDGGGDIDYSNYDIKWGVINLDYAKKYGYEKPGDISGLTECMENGSDTCPIFNGSGWNNPKIINTDNMTPEEKKEYAARTSDGGCSDIAEDEFYKTLDLESERKRTETIGHIQETATNASLSDPKMKTALSAWSDCIKKAGYDYASPADIVKRKFSDDEKELSKSTAIADVECKTASNFMDTWHQVLTEHEQDAINKNLPLFEEEKAYSDSMIKRAQEIIAQNEG